MKVRNRKLYFFLIVVTVILGLCSRKFSNVLPSFIAEYSGDTLWALMIFFIFGFIFKSKATLQIAFPSLICSYAIEFSQMYQADWINAIRHTRLGGLVLGFGFLWSDLLCYTTGVIIGVIIDHGIISSGNKKPDQKSLPRN